MTIARFLQRATVKRRHRHLSVVIFANEASAFQAYRLLHYHGVSPEHLAIVGQGYSSPVSVGLRSPWQIALRKAGSVALMTMAMSTVLSLLIPFFWQPDVSLISLILLTEILCGIWGAVMGGILGFLGEGSTASVYRYHLNQGRYLLMIEGPEKLVRWSQEVLSHYSTPSPQS